MVRVNYVDATHMEYICGDAGTQRVHEVVQLSMKLNRIEGTRWVVNEAFSLVHDDKNEWLLEQIEYAHEYDLPAIYAFVRRAVDKELTHAVDAFIKSFIGLIQAFLTLSPSQWPDGSIKFICTDGLSVEFNFDEIQNLRVEPLSFDGLVGRVAIIHEVPPSWETSETTDDEERDS